MEVRLLGHVTRHVPTRASDRLFSLTLAPQECSASARAYGSAQFGLVLSLVLLAASFSLVLLSLNVLSTLALECKALMPTNFCAVVLRVVGHCADESGGDDVLRAFICAVGRRHLRASLCDSSLDQASAACSRVFRALFAIDQQLALHLQVLGVSAIVCLSWILTPFTHPLSGHTTQVAEVLDFVFASDDDYLVLLCAFVIADNSQLLLQIRDGGDAYIAPLPLFFA